MPGPWGQAGQGAVGGALGGAAAGSAFGPVGTLIGAGAGGILGGIGGYLSGQDQNESRRRMEEYYRRVLDRQAPQAGPAAQANLSSFRGNQSDLVRMLEDQAAGRGPSMAGEQLRAATDRNVRQQAGFAAGQAGSGAGIAAFQAANNIGQLGAQSAQDAGIARIAEINAARQQLGLTLQGARGQDEETGRFNAGQQNEMSRANLEAQLRTMGYNDAAILQIMQGMAPQGPGLGSQLLAGGAGAFGQMAGSRGGSGAPAAGGGFRDPTPGLANGLAPL